MPKITDNPPATVMADLDILRDALDSSVPAKRLDDNLLIATWNLRAFGDLNDKWNSGDSDSPKRDLQSVLAIADIISRFDVIAVQEVRDNIRALRHLLKVLGAHWSFIMTDVTLGDAGNNERMTYLFDTRKVSMSGLAGELVIPPKWLKKIQPDTIQQQFARTPYAVSFRCGKKTFILVTMHVLYGDKPADRVPELKAIAKWMAEWARKSRDWEQNLILLGDFNIDRRDDDLFKALTSEGLQVPDDLLGLPRSLFSKPGKSDSEKFYDQIAWFTGKKKTPMLSMKYIQGGSFNFADKVLRSRGLTKSQLSWRLSDHLPLWAEFRVRD